VTAVRDYAASDWEAIARANGLDSFESIWALDIGWFEEPNQRRGGWSGVSRHDITQPGGSREGIFIKRQQNHTTRSWLHPSMGILTFRREFQNLQLLKSCGVPTLDVLYFAERVVDGQRRAILISRELAGYISFEECVANWVRDGWPDRAIWHDYIHRLAAIARHMHRHRIQQNCFLPKHVFVGEVDGKLDIRLIDFEKAKRRFTVESAMVRDLDTFNRRSPAFRTTDRLRFLLAYHQQPRVNARVRKTWYKLVALLRRKSRNLLRTP